MNEITKELLATLVDAECRKNSIEVGRAGRRLKLYYNGADSLDVIEADLRKQVQALGLVDKIAVEMGVEL